MYLVSLIYSPKNHTKRFGRMLRLAGILLIVCGILLLLAFAFQVPYLYELVKTSNGTNLIVPLLWRIMLIVAGVLLIVAGRNVVRRT
jgi:hypothetical protein